jgi:hypothetical protein
MPCMQDHELDRRILGIEAPRFVGGVNFMILIPGRSVSQRHGRPCGGVLKCGRWLRLSARSSNRPWSRQLTRDVQRFAKVNEEGRNPHAIQVDVSALLRRSVDRAAAIAHYGSPRSTQEIQRVLSASDGVAVPSAAHPENIAFVCSGSEKFWVKIFR